MSTRITLKLFKITSLFLSEQKFRAQIFCTSLCSLQSTFTRSFVLGRYLYYNCTGKIVARLKVPAEDNFISRFPQIYDIDLGRYLRSQGLQLKKLQRTLTIRDPG
ncbi:unnamed protein product [Allacma fusca]|uniref:Uncharacterized protein n=1 Tax=Allacma fusca TaxID=39272 RepID=A0A8J2LGT1_9HEXA|nr:unnamed protein product [Allacma fusca]